MVTMTTIVRDALRGFRTGRASLVLASATFALAIAAATVTFSVVDTIALRPMPFEAPGRLFVAGTLYR